LQQRRFLATFRYYAGPDREVAGMAAASRTTRAGLAIKRNQERNSRQMPYIEAANEQPRNPGLYGYEEPPKVPKASDSPGLPDWWPGSRPASPVV